MKIYIVLGATTGVEKCDATIGVEKCDIWYARINDSGAGTDEPGLTDVSLRVVHASASALICPSLPTAGVCRSAVAQ